MEMYFILNKGSLMRADEMVRVFRRKMYVLYDAMNEVVLKVP